MSEDQWREIALGLQRRVDNLERESSMGHIAIGSELFETKKENDDLRHMCSELAKSLRPFANYACDPEGSDICECHNCMAETVLTLYDDLVANYTD